ncbi:MAG: MFS transporter [Solirubrobacterales bacterium]
MSPPPVGLAAGPAPADSGSTNRRRLGLHAALIVAFLGLSSAWNAGNVGPVASELSGEFDISLATYGVITGTTFFAANLVALAISPGAAERFGVVWALRIACIATVVGNVVIAITPVAGGIVGGRMIAAISLAFASTLTPVYARHVGGVLLLGIFGAAIQLGIGLSIVVGSVLSDAGVDWRVGFFLSALVGAIALALLYGVQVAGEPLRRAGGFLRAAVTKLRVYRLGLLFIGVYAVPVVLAAWLVQYLVDEGGVAAALAGALSFVLFATSSIMRYFGAQLKARGAGHMLLVSFLALASAGMVLLIIESSFALALPAVLALGAGFALPYAQMLVDAQKLFPREPAEPLALLTMVALAVPIAAVPLVGMALDDGRGEFALAALAAFLALATLVNLRPTGLPVGDGVAEVPGKRAE